MRLLPLHKHHSIPLQAAIPKQQGTGPMNHTSMRRRPKFWITVSITGLIASSCGLAAGAGGSEPASKTADAKPRPTVTVTKTTEPEPAVTVTKTAKPKPAPTVTVTATATKTVEAADEFTYDDSNDDSGSGSVYYSNCSEARAAGAAPLYTGQPGYGSHLDRDGDGDACE
jgi:hypothetical protein